MIENTSDFLMKLIGPNYFKRTRYYLITDGFLSECRADWHTFTEGRIKNSGRRGIALTFRVGKDKELNDSQKRWMDRLCNETEAIETIIRDFLLKVDLDWYKKPNSAEDLNHVVEMCEILCDGVSDVILFGMEYVPIHLEERLGGSFVFTLDENYKICMVDYDFWEKYCWYK